MNIIFFGSFQHYSTKILKSLHLDNDIRINAVVTTPPMPAGRNKTLTPTHTHTWAQKHQLPVFHPDHLGKKELTQLPPTELFLTAGFGKIMPSSWLKYPQVASLNVHFSLLPKFRGANPAEWAILLGEKNTGITLIEMDEGIDTGQIIAQQQITIDSKDTRVTLYEKLYSLAAKHLPDMLLKHYRWLQKKDFACQTSLAPQPQPMSSPTPYAKLFKRNDGFIPWECIESTMRGERLDLKLLTSHLNIAADDLGLYTKSPANHVRFIDRAIRALFEYPGVWTIVETKKGSKRMKLHSAKVRDKKLVLDNVQIEGLEITSFNQIKNQITNS